MLFFDFFFYNLYCRYADRNDSTPASSSAIVLAGLLAFNLLTIYLYIGAMREVYFAINKLYGIILVILLQAFTHFRYVSKKQHAVEKIGAKWMNKTVRYRKDITRLHYLYAIGTIICIVWMSVYVGFKRTGSI